jgi:hypothetical protein
MKVILYFTLGLLSICVVGNLYAQAEDCPIDYEVEANFVINQYDAYSVEYDESEQATIEEIANFAVENLDTLGIITAFGHSSVYGSSDIQTASQIRAEKVLDAIEAAIAEIVGEETDTYQIRYDGVGGKCPIASNATQAGRAQNRRVEVWVIDEALMSDDEDDDDDENNIEEDIAEDDPEFNDILAVIQQQTDNAATRCIVKKLQKEESDLAYLAARAINKALNMPESKKAAKIVKKATRQLRSQAEAVYQRIVESTETIVKTPEQRLMRFINQKRRSLMQGINLLDAQANCHNPRIITMRKFVVNHMKKKNSIYSCKPIKKRVKAMLASIGGEIKGCSAN